MIESKDKILSVLRLHSSNVYINDIYRIVLKNEKLNKKINIFDKVLFFLALIYWTTIFGLILIINIFKIKVINDFDEIGLARVARTEVKVRRFNENLQIITDDIVNRDFSIYQIGSRKQRLFFLLFRYIHLCVDDYKDVYKLITKQELNHYSKAILNNLVKRIPHTVVYKYSIDKVVKKNKALVIYTGQMYDRFAIIEHQISTYYGKELVCIPHGVESTLEMPVGYIGNKFYCTSDHMCEKLKLLYQSNKFIYSSEVIERLFKSKSEKTNTNKNIVFFTQPVNRNKIIDTINIIEKHFKPKGVEIYIKLHPADNIMHYKSCDIKVIEDFDDAIVNNICISSTSTVLLESLYNESNAISIINLFENNKALYGDYEFLNDPRIYKPNSINKLIKIIDKKLKIQEEEK